jgi:hypothetical protein
MPEMNIIRKYPNWSLVALQARLHENTHHG